MRIVVLLLAHATVDDINAPISARDLRRPLHVASSVACLPVVQLLLWVSTSSGDKKNVILTKAIEL